MEKYLIIILIILVIYYLIKCWNIKVEYFADTSKPAVQEQSITGSDDTNAINTLAKIAKQLMDGGLTVPGQMTVTNKVIVDQLVVNKDSTFTGIVNASTDVNTKGKLTVDGIITANTDINTTGTLTVGKGATLTGDVNINDNLTVNKNLIRMNPIYRKHDIAGYYQIRAYGYKIPIYYGFNMLWADHNYKERLRQKYKWEEYMFSYTNLDLRQSNDGDQNWVARYLVIFPGYKARMYSWGSNQMEDRDNKIYTSGEYPFSDNNKRLHSIFIALDEEKTLDDLVNIKDN